MTILPQGSVCLPRTYSASLLFIFPPFHRFNSILASDFLVMPLQPFGCWLSLSSSSCIRKVLRPVVRHREKPVWNESSDQARPRLSIGFIGLLPLTQYLQPFLCRPQLGCPETFPCRETSSLSFPDTASGRRAMRFPLIT